jgi:hypothetical protein
MDREAYQAHGQVFFIDRVPIFQISRAVDPESLNPNPDEKNIFRSFRSNITIFLSLCIHIGRPSYGRSLQLSKENIQHFKK